MNAEGLVELTVVEVKAEISLIFHDLLTCVLYCVPFLVSSTKERTYVVT